LVSGLSLERKEKMSEIYEEIKEMTDSLADKVTEFMKATGAKTPTAIAAVVSTMTLQIIANLAAPVIETLAVWLDSLVEETE